MSGEKEIFIVEDSKIIAQIMKQTVDKLPGFTGVFFLTAEDLFEALHERTPALIFLDYFLDSDYKHGLSGRETAVKLNTLLPQTPVVMMTGSSQVDVLENINALPAVLFIHKDAEDVLDQVEEAVLRYGA